ncbi:hypothetical protein HV213_28315 [Klebsiella sp. RHBSTW-00484]|uniref:hypothetical protein n=1 Tax=unclassified Klebsiella TaxID=2608929 RepID=UPI0015E59845|nr:MULTISPECIES: hypothetical protein [unclassified Klebsiella]MBA7844074.1 hypothetical protein [Klebsiella sp. RHBSTW-00465]QLO39440.1 hypothetical protein HV213_28315 [Klebsiella sp. RHBSTW-00484]QLT78962.1 hypothetical protein HV204_28315 [Klebsiella sp. RHBSTW-00464]
MKRIIVPAALCFTLAGCATGAPDMMVIQQATATQLGLASTDEVTVSNVVKGKPSALGGSTVTYDAVTARGRKFTCNTMMMPNLNPLEKPTYTSFQCQPK